MIWKPPLRPGLLVGVALLLVPLLAAVGLAEAALTRDFDVLSALLLLLAVGLLAVSAAVARALYGLLTLSYALGHGGLVIRHGVERHTLALDSIDEIIEAPALGVVRVPGLSWPGYKVGIGRVPRMGRARFYITVDRPGATLLLRTSNGLWVISPQDPPGFIGEWEAAGTGGEVRRQPPARAAGHGLEPRPLAESLPSEARGDRGGFAAAGPEPRHAERPRPAPIYPLRGQPAEATLALDPALAQEDAGLDEGIVSEPSPLGPARALAAETAYAPQPRGSVELAYRADALGVRDVKTEAVTRASDAIRRVGASAFDGTADGEAVRPAPGRLSGPLFQLAVLALIANLALWVFVIVRFPVLGANGLLPVHPNGQGSFDRLVDPAWAFMFPLMGLAILLLNTGLAWLLRDRERLAPPMLIGASLFLELVVWVAALSNNLT